MLSLWTVPQNEQCRVTEEGGAGTGMGGSHLKRKVVPLDRGRSLVPPQGPEGPGSRLPSCICLGTSACFPGSSQRVRPEAAISPED